MSDWSDAKKWTMDLIKSGIAFTVAAIVTLFVVNTVQQSQAFENARASAFYTERVTAMRQLQSETVLYDRSAHTAYTELFQWNSKQKTPAMVEYEQVAYPRWQLVLESANYLFPDCEKAIQALRLENEERYEIYHRFVYAQLDSSRAITPEWMEERRIELWHARPKFEESEKRMSDMRATIIRGMQQALFPIKTHRSSVSSCAG
ncbi:hypothetical protein ACW9YV_15435 (plasmid) [Paraburkholderia strydomiana]